MSKLGCSIRKLRETYGLTQLQLGEKIGVAESTISLYESGKREPDISTMEFIANFFNVSIDYLLGRTENSNSITPSPQSEKSNLAQEIETLSEKDRELIKHIIIKMKEEQSASEFKSS